jgi:uncharacterized repeat protein (TIGR03833 family)
MPIQAQAQHRINIREGMKVGIVRKRDQKTGVRTYGVVKAVLTSRPFHSYGIKVQLESLEIGRVQEIISDDETSL